MHLPLAHQTLAIVGVATAVALVQPAAALTETEERGRQIFTIGSDGSAAITARVGPEGTRIPARGVPCAGCHGADGMGRPEGGSFPPNVTWAALTKPYGYQHANGRVRHAYTEERLMRTLRDGIDAAGNRLEVVMPRYELSDAQARDLIAYMKRLGLENDPGITDTELSLGTLLPSHGRSARSANRSNKSWRRPSRSRMQKKASMAAVSPCGRSVTAAKPLLLRLRRGWPRQVYSQSSRPS